VEQQWLFAGYPAQALKLGASRLQFLEIFQVKLPQIGNLQSSIGN
jgi:hypothetical protein